MPADVPADRDLRGGVDLTSDRLAWGFVLLGTAACLVRWGLCFPIWPDEAFLALNVARRDLAGMLEPLEFHQVAPPLFLLQEALLTRLVGFDEWSLRAVPLLAGVGSLFLFRMLARSILTGWPCVLAVAIFSSSYIIVRYSAEAKPYSGDLFVSVALILLATRWAQAPRRWPALLLLVAIALAGFSGSFPSVFIGGGVVAYMAHTALARRDARRMLEAFLVGAALSAGFCTVYFLHTRHQVSLDMAYMQEYWQRAFPPGQSAGRTLVWIAAGATGELMPYPVGGRNGGSALTLVLFVIGVVDFLRARRHGLLLLLGAAVALAIAAAAMKRYSFGAPARCQLYLAPPIILCAGAGLVRLLALGAAPGQVRRRCGIAAIVLATIGGVTIARDVANPAKTTTDRLLRDWARVIWRGASLAGEPAYCLQEDLNFSFRPAQEDDQSLLASFLCNYYIERPRDAARPPAADLSRGGLVVTYRVADRFRPGRRRKWIEGFAQEHGLRFEGAVVLPVPDVDNHERVRRIDTIEIMRFVPGPQGAGPPPAVP